MYVFTHLLHTGTVVLSVASQRVFLIILLPGPHGFHALLFFFFCQYRILVISFVAETDLPKEAERVLFLQFGSGLCIKTTVIL